MKAWPLTAKLCAMPLMTQANKPISWVLLGTRASNVTPKKSRDSTRRRRWLRKADQRNQNCYPPPRQHRHPRKNNHCRRPADPAKTSSLPGWAKKRPLPFHCQRKPKTTSWRHRLLFWESKTESWLYYPWQSWSWTYWNQKHLGDYWTQWLPGFSPCWTGLHGGTYQPQPKKRQRNTCSCIWHHQQNTGSCQRWTSTTG